MNMCRSRLSVLAAAAAISVGGFTFAQEISGQTNAPPARDRMTSTPGSDLTAPSTRPSDRMNGEAADAGDIRNALASTTEDALTKNSFSNFYGHFVDADRDRISAGEKNITRAEWDKLNGRLESFHKDFKAKYNQDFDINKVQMVFNEQFRIVQGEIGEAQPAGARMGTDHDNTGPGVSGSVRTDSGAGVSGSAHVDTGNTGSSAGASAGATATGSRDPGMPDTTPGPNADKVGGGDTNREPGRNVAKVTFPESHGLPNAYVPMIHEMPDSWKIDVPDQVDARKLYDNLLKHATMLDEHRDQWPADVNDAYRMAAHHVVLAAMDKDASSASGMMQEGAKAMDHAADKATGNR